MRRRLSSLLCLAALCVAAGVSAFALDGCCEVDMHCPPCASMLCWVAQGGESPKLAAPALCAGTAELARTTATAILDGFVPEARAVGLTAGFDLPPPPLRLCLRV